LRHRPRRAAAAPARPRRRRLRVRRRRARTDRSRRRPGSRRGCARPRYGPGRLQQPRVHARVAAMPTHEPLTDPLVEDTFYAGDPFPQYARLRDEAPVAWNDTTGVWAGSRWEDVMAGAAD